MNWKRAGSVALLATGIAVVACDGDVNNAPRPSRSVGQAAENHKKQAQAEYVGDTDQQSEAITEMTLAIGGYGPSYRVELKDGVLKYYAREFGAPQAVGEVVESVDDQALATFLATLIELQVFDWEEEYVRPNVVDGTSWRIHIITNKREIKSFGSNDYPGEEIEGVFPSEPFFSYRKAVMELIGPDRMFY